jgi:hypothetical protein
MFFFLLFTSSFMFHTVCSGSGVYRNVSSDVFVTRGCRIDHTI